MKKNPVAALLAALNATPASEVVPPGFLTMNEIADRSGWSRGHANKKLAKLTGVERKVFRVQRDGCLRHVPHYRLNGK